MSVDAIGGRFSVAGDIVANTIPIFGGLLRGVFVNVADWLDNHILTKTEKEIGKLYYSTMIVRMKK